jgi:hypothetical protein
VCQGRHGLLRQPHRVCRHHLVQLVEGDEPILPRSGRSQAKLGIWWIGFAVLGSDLIRVKESDRVLKAQLRQLCVDARQQARLPTAGGARRDAVACAITNARAQSGDNRRRTLREGRGGVVSR